MAIVELEVKASGVNLESIIQEIFVGFIKIIPFKIFKLDKNFLDKLQISSIAKIYCRDYNKIGHYYLRRDRAKVCFIKRNKKLNQN